MVAHSFERDQGVQRYAVCSDARKEGVEVWSFIGLNGGKWAMEPITPPMSNDVRVFAIGLCIQA